jgi:hypothetical protein
MRRGRRRRGKIWRTTPPSQQIRLPQGAVSAKFVEPLNLLQSVQTYFCLGHCITRGIGLRRQASIPAQRFLEPYRF